LKARLGQLAGREWRHPITEKPVTVAFSTIERWYYRALNERKDPVGKLRRKVRSDSGQQRRMNDRYRAAIRAQYRAHPGWSYRLHADNLKALERANPDWGPAPSYDSVRRHMKGCGLIKRRRRGPAARPGAQAAEDRFENREVRSYEADYVNGLWHLDFHSGSLRVLKPDGEWAWPKLLGILDDHSRLICHAQWYLRETAENLVHGLSQAIQKRGLPRALMSDNGSAMVADETKEGLLRLGILHELTLPYSPYQNGKQEVFWGQVEGRLLAMLEGVADLTLARLNELTQAWLEMEYNRRHHSEIAAKPITRYVGGKDVGRPSPASEDLRIAFTARTTRRQRRSDGTVSVDGTRFEIPSRYGHMEQIHLRYAGWDLSHVYLCDPKTGDVLCRVYPLDRSRNADGQRRMRDTHASEAETPAPASGMPPLLAQIEENYKATGLPASYLPKDESDGNFETESDTDSQEASA
jgi:transposase InsO family protein